MSLPCAVSMHKVNLPTRLVQLLSVSKDASLCTPPPSDNSEKEKDSKRTPK